jgi:hypothetical protein
MITKKLNKMLNKCHKVGQNNMVENPVFTHVLRLQLAIF